MNTIPFPTPRTPKGYRFAADPTSPLANYGQPLPLELPSLKFWKDTCRANSFSSSSSSGSDTSNRSTRQPTGVPPALGRGRNCTLEDENDYPTELIEAPTFIIETITTRTEITEEDIFLGTGNLNLNDRAFTFVRKRFKQVLAKGGVNKRKTSKKKSSH
ncbi:unnamed protein product [Somion occarium]|uniref:Uncharacterized protein n=1 Tax=Somion occarium TaxID=3059160 RepID=A0ABP1E1L4_9APHY